ncbi:MAG: hypothetical protein CMJ75_21300 [Planctomycetaceae bacterium]|nr:hypothetical protein [Planctomycetaceae bacterium]
MHVPRSEPGLQSLSRANAEKSPSDSSSPNENFLHQKHNFFVLVVHQILMRTGWIFKTESIIMPAVLDWLGGTGFLRGCLPMLNRFGQSIPPLLLSRRIKLLSHKKTALAACGLVMALCFLALSAIWYYAAGRPAPWMAMAFLIGYAAFFMGTGVNQLVFSTLQGKLIPARRRGRLMLCANVLGAIVAITCAAILLKHWLRPGNTEFTWIFGFTGISFALSACTGLFLVEQRDAYSQATQGIGGIFRSAFNILTTDTNFRRCSIVAALYGSSIMLMPHYQLLGRQAVPGYESQANDLSVLTFWVIVQNAGTALFSLVAGPLADRFGNRLVLQVLLLCLMFAPITALLLSQSNSTLHHFYPVVFLLVGPMPIVIRTLNNLTLELSPRAEHPRYLGTLNLCLSGPVVLSPLIGLLIDLFGFSVVFSGTSLIILLSWLMTFRLYEPRHHNST